MLALTKKSPAILKVSANKFFDSVSTGGGIGIIHVNQFWLS
jgi:hypothetical protein